MVFNGKKFVEEMMCRRARFTAELTREDGEKEGEKVWKLWGLEERDGWIVGAKYLRTGIQHPGYTPSVISFHTIDDCEAPFFEDTAPRQLVYLVTPWPMAKPRYVPPEHVTLVEEGERFDPSMWDSASRERASDWSRDYPRDEKGRWAKEKK
jgi:hypothetical protein